jgi:hypothetical protein
LAHLERPCKEAFRLPALGHVQERLGKVHEALGDLQSVGKAS